MDKLHQTRNFCVKKTTAAAQPIEVVGWVICLEFPGPRSFQFKL